MLDAARVTELLQPFLGDSDVPAELIEQLRTYLELLLRWNARTNLTAVRDPEQIVTRHFGEGLFAARLLRGAVAFSPNTPPTLADIGSGAGFPGLPIKLMVPDLRVTLLESQNKKATFLREVIRALSLENTEVFCDRAENWKRQATVVSLRAVGKFSAVLPVVARLVSSQGTLCLLIGANQVEAAIHHLRRPGWELDSSVPIPMSQARVILIGKLRLDL